MPLRRLLAVFAFASLMILGFPAFRPATVSASVGFQPVSPEELKMTSVPEAPGAPGIILYRQVDRDDNGTTSHEDNYFRIKILTEEGRKYADIEIPFFKESGEIDNIKARTIRPDGSIVNFDGKVFEKSIAKARGLKYLAKTFTLPDVEPGSIIEYYYTKDLTENKLYDSHWILSNELFTKTAKFSLKPYHSEYETWNIRWIWQLLPKGTSEPKQGGDSVVRLEVHNIPAFQTEDFMPPENELQARVDFIYSQDSFESDAEKYWKKTGKKMNDKLESLTGKRKAMEQALAQIVSPADSPDVKLQKIYDRVQQMRNTSYEVQKTEQEQKRAKEKALNNVEDVWKQNYGDGVQLTWLYLALVRAAGFDAYGVWVSDRSNYFFNAAGMDSSKLDANVVLVKLNGKDVYCDPGAKFTPFGLLPWVETGVTGLRLDKDGGSWVQTTLPPSSASRIERKADLKLSSDSGSLEGKLTVTYTGLEALRRRTEERNVDETGRKEFLENAVKEYIPAAAEVELANQPDWNSSSFSMVAEFNLKVPGWVSAAGHRALMPVGLFSAPEKHLFDHAARVHPVYMEFPFQLVDDVTIELPAGWQVSSLPTAQNQDGHIIVYTLKADKDKDKGKLHLERSLDLGFLILETKYYLALREFFQVVRAGDEEQAVLQPGATASN
jgi:hypothetical protein